MSVANFLMTHIPQVYNLSQQKNQPKRKQGSDSRREDLLILRNEKKRWSYRDRKSLWRANSMLKKQIFFVPVVLLFSVLGSAQTNATVGGRVGDAGGAVIPGVEV